MENISLRNLFKKSTISDLLKMFLPGFLFLMLLIFFSFLTKTDFGLLSRDVNGIFDAPPYVGLLSNIGCIFWSFTVAILFFTYKLSIVLDNNKKQSNFLLLSGALSLLMLMDDMFLFHEYVVPVYLHLHDSLFYFIYGLSVILIFYFYFKLILKSDYILFLIAFVFFAMSGFFSESQDYFSIALPHQHILEDGTKFLGILSWFFYFVITCYKYMLSFKKLV
jgi:hypothetical protein